MSYQGRSLDDLPLAAYSTGVVEDEPEEEAVAEAHQLSQQEAVAQALGIEAPRPADAVTQEHAETAGPRPSLPRPSLPRPSLPRPSLPRFSLPRLPRFGGRPSAAADAASPFAVTDATFGVTAAPAADPPFAVTRAVASPVAGQSLAMPFAPAPSHAATPVARPAGLPARLDLGGLGAALRNPRVAARDPRVLFGGMIGIGVVLLGASFLLGGNQAGGAGAGASPSPAPGAGGPAGPGPASILVTGDFDASVELTGTAGFGKPAERQLAATWDDGAGSSIDLSGSVGSGTRPTSPTLVLVVTVSRNGVPVRFTSEAGECAIGMAEKMFNVTGSFVCREITSDDGRLTVKLEGKYQT